MNSKFFKKNKIKVLISVSLLFIVLVLSVKFITNYTKKEGFRLFLHKDPSFIDGSHLNKTKTSNDINMTNDIIDNPKECYSSIPGRDNTSICKEKIEDNIESFMTNCKDGRTIDKEDRDTSGLFIECPKICYNTYKDILESTDSDDNKMLNKIIKNHKSLKRYKNTCL
jgi:hypothetical protein